MLSEHEVPIRVHYHEVDGQGRVHNSQYLNYFERGRVEMLRASGFSYRELEQNGLMLVVRSMQVEFHWPAEFDPEDSSRILPWSEDRTPLPAGATCARRSRRTRFDRYGPK